MVYFETFNDVDNRRGTDFKTVLTIVLDDGSRTLFLVTVEGCRGGVVHCLSFHEVYRNLNRSSEHIQPVVALVGIGKERTAVDIIAYFLHMVEEVAHVEEVHHTPAVDNGTRHQGGAERDVVEIGDRSRVGQFLLVEVYHLESGAERQVGILCPIDI